MPIELNPGAPPSKKHKTMKKTNKEKPEQGTVNNYGEGAYIFPMAQTVTVYQTIVYGKKEEQSICYQDFQPTGEEMALLRKAEKQGLVSREGETWKALVGASLLDYLLGRIFAGDTPEWDEHHDSLLWHQCSGKQLPQKDLRALFADPNIGKVRASRSLRSVPKGHEKVDKLFAD